ncbi:MAG TPA: DUF4118 domain-containing protein [Woeseiaceae bacterium]|nr:DUF4118 domain-containing protein [Woeseiaceae bacterium]
MKHSDVRRKAGRGRKIARHLRTAAEIAGLLAAAVLVGYVLQRLHHANLSVVFLFVVLIIAARHGLWPSIVTSALGFLAFNFFFTAPYRTFLVTEQGDIATLAFFLAVAILGGNLAARLRTAIQRRDQALDRISNLYEFSNRITGATTSRDILETLVEHVSGTLEIPALVVERSASGDLAVRAASPSPPPTADSMGATVAADVVSESACVPIRVPDQEPMQLAIQRADLGDEQMELVRNLCSQAEVALDRIRLAEDLDSSRREAERARLRSALLTSVSHDLRTPLSSIFGAASTVQELGDSLAASDRAELLETVMGEARRLNGYIQNLLDMTRIEHGELQITRDWEEPSDLFGAALRRVKESWPDAVITLRIADDASLVRLHGELFVQALYNVIDNAVRYSPPGTPIDVACLRDGDGMRVEVTDAGPGLTARQRKRIFDMFYRAESGDSRSGGTGLGLAITRGIIEAHSGKVFAEAGPGGQGTRIVILLPGAMPVRDRSDEER